MNPLFPRLLGVSSTMTREQRVSRGQTALAAFGFVAVVGAIAGAALQLGQVPVGFGLTAGAGGLFVGVLFVVRDLLHQWLSIAWITLLVFACGIPQIFFIGPDISQEIVLANVVTLIGATTAQAVWFGRAKRRAGGQLDTGSWEWLRVVAVSSLVFGMLVQTALFGVFVPQIFDQSLPGGTSLVGSMLIKTYGVSITVAAAVVGAYFANRRRSREARFEMRDPRYAPVVSIRSKSKIA